MNRLDKLPDGWNPHIDGAFLGFDSIASRNRVLKSVNDLLASGKARVMNDFVLIDELQPPLRGRVLIIELE